ncbi:hypothetical protein GGS21DRAFT_490714 [Xylaria nigripes]|nr:hypothetical protein GGS21DRAFT_490714 [Xylaria nigripes]
MKGMNPRRPFNPSDSSNSDEPQSTDLRYYNDGSAAKRVIDWDTGEAVKKPRRQETFRYWSLPLELRIKIFDLALPQQIFCVGNYLHSRSVRSTHAPAITSTFDEWTEEVEMRGRTILFTLLEETMNQWVGWAGTNSHGLLRGATIILNVLELIEDRYRGSLSSDMFTKQIKAGSFQGVKEFQLVLLTIEDPANLTIYGDDVRAAVDLDDRCLPEILEPVYTRMRKCSSWPSGVRHVTETKLVTHLKRQWKKLKWLFEEQWLRSHAIVWERAAFTEKLLGYKDKQHAVDRTDREVEKLIRQMPSIRPVVLFENKRPGLDNYSPFGMPKYPDRKDPKEKIWFGGKRGRDGLTAISNRRGLFLSTAQYAGRLTLV